MVRRLVDVLIVAWVLAFAAFLVTGGWDVMVAGIHIESRRASSLLAVIGGLAAIRLALTVGITGSLIVAMSIAFALGVGELLVRWFTPSSQGPIVIHRASDLYGWELTPHTSGFGLLGEKIDINADGQRDRERTYPASGAFRIALVGDSFTFGMGVALEDTYGKKLETLLRTNNPNVDVSSFGVIAYQLWQLVLVLQNRVPEFQPDLVVMAFFYDDLVQPSRPAELNAADPFEKVAPSGSRVLDLWRTGLRSLRTRFRYLDGARYLATVDERRSEIGPGGKYDLWYRAQAGLLDEPTYAAARADLETIADWSKVHAIPVLAVLIPDSSQLGQPDRQGANRFFAAELARVGIPFHDLTPALERDPDPRT